MSRRRRGLDIHGVVLLDKPAGISSNRALQKVRGIFQARKAGHTGSLDPFATGMLPICLGEASKTAAFMLDASKQYRATARLGQATATGDVEGDIVQVKAVPDIDRHQINLLFRQFVGRIQQVPPMYSAIKYKGKPMYEWARAGMHVERPARTVTIHRLQLSDWRAGRLTFDVHCSKGTYIRTLAEDIATQMGSCAHLVSLRRNYVEPFERQAMVTLEQLQEAREGGCLVDFLLPPDSGLSDWPRIVLDDAQQARFRHGNPVRMNDTSLSPGQLRVYARGGGVIGLASYTEQGLLKPSRVFNC